MNDMFKKMIAKKKAEGKGLSDVQKKAKMSVVGGMKKMASEAINDRLGGLKKVTVASDSPEGLAEGLDKAEDIIEGEDAGGMPAPMLAEEEHDEEMPSTPEEIDAKIAELQALKAQMKSEEA